MSPFQFRFWRELALGWFVLASFPMLSPSQIIVTKDPFANPSPAPVDVDIAFNLSASDTTDGTLTYSWDFGDGSEPTALVANPAVVHRYAKPGRFSVLVSMEAGVVRQTLSFFLLVHAPWTNPRPTASSTIALDAKRQRIWVVNADNNSVTCIDAVKLEKLFEASVGGHPRTLGQAPDGSIWVTNQDDATISVLDPETGALLKSEIISYGSQPFGIAFSPDGKDAYVSLQATGKLIKLDPANVRGKLWLEVPVQGDPRGIAITSDSKRVLVTRFISPADHGEISDVDATAMTANSKITLEEDKGPDTENSGRGIPNYLTSIAIAPDGGQVWILAKKDNTSRGLVRDGRALDFQSTVRAMVMRVDLATGKEDLPHRLDMDDSEIPSAIAFGPLGDPAFLAFQGSNKVIVWDPNANVRMMSIPSVGLAPQGLLVDSALGRLFVQNFMSRTVSVYDVSTILSGSDYIAPQLKVIGTVTKDKLSDQVLLGKQIFYNAADLRMSKDGYISCATCHLDGGTDRRVWDFTDRGEGLRKTVSLLGRSGMGHGPVHWSANFDEIQDFENDIRGPFGGNGFMKDADFHANGHDQTLGGKKAGLSPELDALAAYVSSLTQVHASPYRNQDGSLTDDAKEGEKVFNRPEVGCARCHIPPLYTDSRLTGAKDSVAGDIFTPEGFRVHDVGTLNPSAGKRLKQTLLGFDTPTLKGIWEMPPYLHDGSAATLEDVLTTANSGDKHGHTSQLSDVERKQLVAFLQQLDDGAPGAGILPRSQKRSGFRFTITSGPGVAGYRLQLEWPPSKGTPHMVFHDLGGKIVDTYSEAFVRSRSLKPGQISLYWNGWNARGQALASGLYSVEACLEAECQVRTLVLIF